MAMLRMRAGLDLGWPTNARCSCQKKDISIRHALFCSYTELYQTRHNAPLQALMRLVRRAGAMETAEPLRPRTARTAST